jgi:hypothetical protein
VGGGGETGRGTITSILIAIYCTVHCDMFRLLSTHHQAYIKYQQKY